MSRFRTLALALAAPVFLAPPATAAPDAAREIVVALAPAKPARGAAIEAGLAQRLGAAGLTIARRLDEGLPAQAAVPSGAARRLPPDLSGFDPARIVLVTAADPPAARAALERLAADPAVAWAEPNPIRTPAVEWVRGIAPAGPRSLDPGFPNDPLFEDGRQWGLRNPGPSGPYAGTLGADIHALDAWARSVGSNDVLLGVADTGIDPAHPDLAATLPDGSPRIAYSFVASTGSDRSVLDRYAHGTLVAGVCAALTHNGVQLDSLGMAGVCGGDGGSNLGCRIVPIKVTRDSGGVATAFDFARAILYATRAGCRAVNLSFAGPSPSNLERAALRNAMMHGCVAVAASGNDGYFHGRDPQYPAAYAAEGLCIQVGASDEWDRRAIFSSYGPGLDLLAPGVDVWTTFMTYPSAAGASFPGYAAAAGTSFAAPFVTGTLGLLAAARPELDASDFQHLLRESADDIGAPGPDVETGWGRLNAAAALARVAPGIGIWHDEIAAGSLTEVGSDSVRIEGDAPPAAAAFAGWHRARRFELTAVVTLPDSFQTAEVWPRLGGTSTVRAASSGALSFVPWADGTPLDPRHVMLRGTLYRIADAVTDPPEDTWIPVPPDQARFGFTVIGPVSRAAAVSGAPPGPAPRLAAAPNPMRGVARLEGPPGAALEILDVSGRAVARGALDATGRFLWDGRDGSGRAVAPGLYLARCRAGGRALTARIVRL